LSLFQISPEGKISKDVLTDLCMCWRGGSSKDVKGDVQKLIDFSMKKMILITQFLRGALFRMSLDFSGGAILIRSTEKESFFVL
jgi:hypothetical protein